MRKSALAKKITESAGTTSGFALVFGTDDIRLLEGLVAQTSLSIIAYDKDPERIDFLREYFDGLGITANRLSFLQYDKTLPLLPKYFSSLTVINEIDFPDVPDKDMLGLLYESTRPYDGKIMIRTTGKEYNSLSANLEELNLFGAEHTFSKGYTIISRTGPLEGTDSWTHNNGDIANTLKSDDKLVKAPLGILWFGGNSNLDVLPRHGHGAGEQVIDGRLIIQGIGSISARDVYTGRVLWRRSFTNLNDDAWLVYYDETYDEEDPLDPKYNQVHLPVPMHGEQITLPQRNTSTSSREINAMSLISRLAQWLILLRPEIPIPGNLVILASMKTCLSSEIIFLNMKEWNLIQ